MQQIKERYERLKQWQQKSIDYEFASNDVQHCNNCGHDFTGNFCPYCSQKAGEGPIGWDTVRQSMMDIWGLGTRSLINTIGQLLLRPGYLIGDFISGKRKVSFPPVRMLFIVSVIVVFWIYYLMPFLLGKSYDVYGGTTDIYSGFDAWNRKHFVWTYFILALVYVVPTWLIFRYAPRHTRHTLPQDFFIQVFMLVLNLVVGFIALTPLLIWDFTIYYGASMVVMVVYYVVAYKQLFGYGIWGTLWRVVIVEISSAFLISALGFLVFDVDFSKMGGEPMPGRIKYAFVGLYIFLALLMLGFGWGINLLFSRKSRRHA